MVAIRDAHLDEDNASVSETWISCLAQDTLVADALVETYVFCQTLGNDDARAKALLFGREMVEILVTLNMDKDTLITALLFPFVEENSLSLDDVKKRYGQGVFRLIEGVREMAAIRHLNHRFSVQDARDCDPQITAGQVDNVRRMLLAMVDDFRCVVIKLAERISYLRKVKDLPEERLYVARECANIYAPLANRLGIGQLKWEMEDYAFRYLHADTYKQIAKQLSERRLVREEYIQTFVTDLQGEMEAYRIDAQVCGRPKHIYSIWRKMQKKNLAFDELFDVRAVRIIADKLQDCYAALGVVHTKYRHLPSEFDDYVANPKPNGYQSIHTVVLGPEGKTIEIQIRTKQMHDDAELGVAAHWKYKEGATSGRSGYDEKITWLRKLLVWQEEMSDSGEILEELRSQVSDDRVYAFTPKGDVMDLPIGATPLDFAYHIHSEVGHCCIGAKVEGRIVPFTYQLNMGDQVEIITQKEPNPSRDWLNPSLGFVNSGRARAKINAWFRKQAREKNVAAGKEILDAELLKIGTLSKSASIALPRFNVNSLEELYVGVGSGDLRINQVINFINSQVNKLSKAEEDDQLREKLGLVDGLANKKNLRSAVVVEGVDNLMTHLARCCQPISGDEIEGYVTQGRGISVHRKDCVQLAELRHHAPERIIETIWGGNYLGQYQITARVIASERHGLLKDLTAVLSNEKVKVTGMQTRFEAKTNQCIMDFDLDVSDLEVLSRTLIRLEQVKEVFQAKRLY